MKQELPENMEQVIRFDSTGYATPLGPMTKDGFESLLEMWFDCGFAIFAGEADEVLCLFPVWYLDNDQSIPHDLMSCMSLHLIMWRNDTWNGDEGEEWKPDYN